jgi:hypothetical protein
VAARRAVGLADLLVGGFGVAAAMGRGPAALGGREGLLLAVPCLVAGALLLLVPRDRDRDAPRRPGDRGEGQPGGRSTGSPGGLPPGDLPPLGRW